MRKIVCLVSGLLLAFGIFLPEGNTSCSNWPKKRIYFNTEYQFTCNGSITHYRLCNNVSDGNSTGNVSVIVHIWQSIGMGPLHTRGSAEAIGDIALENNDYNKTEPFDMSANYNSGDYLGYELVHDESKETNRCSVALEVTASESRTCDQQKGLYLILTANNDCYMPRQVSNMNATTGASVPPSSSAVNQSSSKDLEILPLTVGIMGTAMVVELIVFVVLLLICGLRMQRKGKSDMTMKDSDGSGGRGNLGTVHTNTTVEGPASGEPIYEFSGGETDGQDLQFQTVATTVPKPATTVRHSSHCYSSEQPETTSRRKTGSVSCWTDKKTPEGFYHVLEQDYAQTDGIAIQSASQPTQEADGNYSGVVHNSGDGNNSGDVRCSGAPQKDWGSDGANAASKVQLFTDPSPVYEMEDLYQNPAKTMEEVYQQIVGLKADRVLSSKDGAILRERLGEGEFGAVYKGEWIPVEGRKEVAFKTLHTQNTDARVKLLQEAAIMGQFNHANVARLYGVIVSDEKTMMVMEFLRKGDLQNFLIRLRDHTAGHSCSDEHQLALRLKGFCKDVVCGMSYLSSKGFVHRDLAARNVLLDGQESCKIADFGMSRRLDEDSYYITKGGRIPLKWTAPEAIFYKKYTTKSDVWSFGMVLYEIWSLGCKPFEEFSPEEVMIKFQEGYCQPPPPGCPRDIYSIMVDCWHPDSHKRPTFNCAMKDIGQACLSKDGDKDDNMERKQKSSPAFSLFGSELSAGANVYRTLQFKYRLKSRNS